MRIVAFTKYDREAASTRYRILQYRPAFAEAGIVIDHRPLLPDDYVRNLATHEGYSKTAILAAYARRLRDLIARGPSADVYWVYAELLPYLPAAVEKLIFRAAVPVVYDWDDAFFIPYERHSNPVVTALLGRKFEQILSRAAAVTCGNPFLADYAHKFCRNTLVVPTVVDIDVYRPAASDSAKPLTIGWIGSPSTWPEVRPVLPAIARVCQQFGARFRAVGAGPAAAADCFDAMELVPWREDSEVREVQQFDIGIMPLHDGPFQKGKSGFKLVQYMACAVPVVASPVGVNADIISHGLNGFLSRDAGDWHDALTRLAGDADLRATMGLAGRERAVSDYSLQSQAPRLIELFRELGGDRG